MVNLEVPQVNVLSKADLLPSDLPYDIDFFQQLPDLKYLIDLFDVSRLLLCVILSLLGKSGFCQVQNVVPETLRAIWRV